ncbi:hypothetical protein HK102_003997 [Quaeritorhiza haematococci]|nr:hypothetical protein HK102_003997 [Quaeritorhiza haematococci]
MNNLAQKEFWSIVIGGTVLAMNAGFINVVTLAGVFSVTVSHVTGNVTKIAIALFTGDFTMLIMITSILFSFMFGSFIAGFMVGDNKFKLGRAYGYALLLESAALFGSFIFLRKELIVGEWCAAFGCGLQNALATSYSGAVVRTTHMTGILTDIGNFLGQACRTDTNTEVWRLKVLVPLLFGYMLGGIIGQTAYLFMRENSFLLPCFFTGAVAMVYLSLPFIQQATKSLQSQPKGPKPAFEVRPIGDPTKHADVYQKLQGKDIDGDINKFLNELGSPTHANAVVVAANIDEEKGIQVLDSPPMTQIKKTNNEGESIPMEETNVIFVDHSAIMGEGVDEKDIKNEEFKGNFSIV